ncbi:MAG: hypothetical protein E7123_07840 [Bacteroidales bacterium]|nr:hypothetical protein [Bacteroidales bacterium]
MRIPMFIAALFLATGLSAESFEELKGMAAGRESVVLPQGTVIEGVIVSDYRSHNMETPVQVSFKEVDPGLNFRTAYLQSLDGKSGLRIQFNSVYDNRFPRFCKVKMDLGGAVLTRETDPERYTVSNLVGAFVSVVEQNVKLSPKVRHIADLTDADLYTLVTLADVEFMSKEGSYTNVHEKKVARTYINSFKTHNDGPIDGSGLVLKDNQGDDIFMPVNTRCTWRRNGDRVPQGVGSVDGILVHTVLRRYGDIGRYAIRPASSGDIRIPMEASSSYETIAEWNWDRNYDVALNFERQGLKEWIFGEVCAPDRVLPDVGQGYLSTTAGAMMRLDNEWNSRCVHDGNDAGAGAREWSVLRLESDTKDWYIFDGERIAGSQAVLVETSTKGFEGKGLSFEFTFAAGNCSAGLSWGFPGEWQVAYSVDGRNYIPVSKTFLLRPLWYGAANIKELGGVREMCYDAAPGSIECRVALPAFLLDKDRVYFRIYPSSDKLTVLPENPEDDINSGTMQNGFSHQFVLRLGKVSVKSLKN